MTASTGRSSCASTTRRPRPRTRSSRSRPWPSRSTSTSWTSSRTRTWTSTAGSLGRSLFTSDVNGALGEARAAAQRSGPAAARPPLHRPVRTRAARPALGDDARPRDRRSPADRRVPALLAVPDQPRLALRRGAAQVEHPCPRRRRQPERPRRLRERRPAPGPDRRGGRGRTGPRRPAHGPRDRAGAAGATATTRSRSTGWSNASATASTSCTSSATATSPAARRSSCSRARRVTWPGPPRPSSSRAVRHLERPPRLIVLASCQTAGAGDARSHRGRRCTRPARATARRGRASRPCSPCRATCRCGPSASSCPSSSASSTTTGCIDHAAAVARWAVRNRPDWWAPALYMRLKTGRLWYAHGSTVVPRHGGRASSATSRGASALRCSAPG